MMSSVGCTLEPVITSPLVHDYPLPRTGQYITDLRLNCQAVVTDVNFIQGYTLRLPLHDIDKVEFLIDQRVVHLIENTDRTDPSGITVVHPLYSSGLHFYFDNRLLTAALPPVTLRVTFWRPPVSPIWLTCQVHYIEGDNWTGQVLPVMNTQGQVYHYWNNMVWF
jgi:hypothetical protein